MTPPCRGDGDGAAPSTARAPQADALAQGALSAWHDPVGEVDPIALQAGQGASMAPIISAPIVMA